MSLHNYLILIIGMSLVTFIPRAIPALLIEHMALNKKTEKFLKLIPYTAMTALIFPGILSVDESRMVIGIIGGLVAMILSWKKCPLMISVIAAIVADYLLYMIC